MHVKNSIDLWNVVELRDVLSFLKNKITAGIAVADDLVKKSITWKRKKKSSFNLRSLEQKHTHLIL